MRTSVIIPQTREHAIQRDLAYRHPPTLPEDPAVELANLRNAIRHHQATVEQAGPISDTAGALTTEQLAVADTKHQADLDLWAHVTTPGQETA